MAEGAGSASPASARGDLNTEFWSGVDLVGSYAGDQLRPVEALLFDRHREALTGRVLEIGSGGGRVTRHLLMLADDVHGIDISPAMVQHTSRAYPQATIILRDLRDLSVYEDASFDALVAPFNVLDVLDQDGREAALDGFSRVVVGGGLVIISSHNRHAAASVRGPGGQLLAHLRERRFRSAAAGVVRFPQRFANHRRLRRFEREERGYAIVNDSAHHYALLHYYISRDDQERQLEAHGFELIESLDLEGRPLAAGDRAPSSSELHYVARRV